mgnify:CR=1 FL=1
MPLFTSDVHHDSFARGLISMFSACVWGFIGFFCYLLWDLSFHDLHWGHGWLSGFKAYQNLPALRVDSVRTCFCSSRKYVNVAEIRLCNDGHSCIRSIEEILTVLRRTVWCSIPYGLHYMYLWLESRSYVTLTDVQWQRARSALSVIAWSLASLVA